MDSKATNRALQECAAEIARLLDLTEGHIEVHCTEGVPRKLVLTQHIRLQKPLEESVKRALRPV